MSRAPAREPRWRARPARAALLRAVVYVGPVAAAVVTGIAIGRLWPRAEGAGAVVRVVVALVASTAVLYGADRLLRRLLPLAAMLRLSMVFPDRLPSRFGIALAAGSPRTLEERMARLPTAGAQVAAETLLALVTALSRHDAATRGHSERVRGLAEVLGEEMGLDRDDLDRLRWSALLHDVGKLAVPREVLNKAGALDEDEWSLVRKHPQEGARIVEPLRPWLGDWLSSVDQHHERWDGSGYPLGLSGEGISLAGRIVAVADAFEVMTARRSYRAPVDPAAAREELVRSQGGHFDPAVVRALLNVSIGRLRRALGPTVWLLETPVLVGGVPTADPAGVDVPDLTAIAAPTLHPAAHRHAAAQAGGAAQGRGDDLDLDELRRQAESDADERHG